LTPAERKTLLLAVDLILVNAALLVAVTLWNGFTPSLRAVWLNSKWFVTLIAVWLLTAAVLDVYDLVRAASTTSILASAGLAALLGGIFYLAVPWLTPPILTRRYALGFVVLMVLWVSTWRVLYSLALVQPAFHLRAILVGAARSSHGLVRELRRASRDRNANPFRGSGYEIVGQVCDRTEGVSDELPGLPWLGEISDLSVIAARYGVDEVIVALGNGHPPSAAVHEALLDCRELDVRVRSLTEVYERLTARLPVAYSQRDTGLVLGPVDSPTHRLYATVKRCMDLVLGLLGVAAMVPLIPAVALGNAFWSPGPLFYRQTRTGKGGRSFVLIKFRSMVVEAEKHCGAKWSDAIDPRITRVGRLLRITHLDELPQFINVLRGEMSAVGPRPERPCFVGELSRQLPLYRARHAVKPGVSGWAQIRYPYGNSIEDSRLKLEYDLYYVKHASLYLDLLILLQTVPVVFSMKGR
jgi:exopolysaccharide biosynthesis polyprenyl glycosylphosphotransferase